MGELPRAAGLGIENPQLLVPAPRRREDDVSSIGRPGRIFILTFAGELLRIAVAQIDHPDLEKSILLLVRDGTTVRRPVRARTVAPHAWLVWRKQLNVGPVRIHNINLRRTRLPRYESDLTPIRAVRWRSVVRASAD